MNDKIPVLDVRDDLRKGQEPMQRILTFVKGLPESASWRLVATFEPIPLMRMMQGRGYQGSASRRDDGDWDVLFAAAGPGAAKAKPAQAPRAAAVPAKEPAISLDNRGLMPPEPMVRVLEALSTLPDGDVLDVKNDRVPAFLYPELSARGYDVHTEQTPDFVHLRIWRAPS